MPAPTVIGVNYHRIGDVDPANPYHRLHTVSEETFARQLDMMLELGQVVSLDQVRAGEGLAEVNFVLCFDDVPVSALTAIDQVRACGLPLTLSPAGLLTDTGLGSRDKVYAIEKYADPAAIAEHIAARLPEAAGLGTFYQLTKSAELDPEAVAAQLIDPLYATVEAAAAPYFAERGYLPWPKLRELALDPLVTVANHSFGHTNLAALDADAVRQEVDRSHVHFQQRMGIGARYFTVPFGRLTQELALDLQDPLAALGYAGILWVGSAGVRIHAPYEHQLLHLMRLHTDDSSDGFAAQVQAATRDATRAAIWQVPATVHRRPVQVVHGSGARRAGQLEMLLRQGKDYASDPRYYQHQFTDNPQRGTRPDYCTVEADGRPEAIVYSFHTRFALNGQAVPGVYLSGWRKLPHAHAAAAGQLLRVHLDREPVVGVYRPNPDIHAAFRGWHRAPVHQLDLPVTSNLPQAQRITSDVEESATFPMDFEALCIASARRAGFTVVRDPAYHHWRHTTYPVAPATYLAVRRAGGPTALAITLHLHGVTHVIDFHLAAEEKAASLIAAVLAHAGDHGSTTVRWETSSHHVAQVATERFAATDAAYENFYRFNPALLADHGIAPPAERWHHLPLHETATTSDVLPR
ncbi:polysaccharide deacetylase family protein [Streptomyces virginiae]|uniref:polysaccharide deacetylase family protein n=1 Tax=Streptomyces TaxID=1883 RepID=UPI002E28BF07|nr:polysaccharide deacetylase family protein [Streptomyces sp. NBC_00239]WSX96988.1 polysaccharide deacetylase family protein [Streptomyces goshikiensis]